MLFRRDPGPCPVDDAPHTTCCAPGASAVITAGPITPATAVTVPGHQTATPRSEAPAPPASPVETTATYRRRKPPRVGRWRVGL
jgi:hypothetical protein